MPRAAVDPVVDVAPAPGAVVQLVGPGRAHPGVGRVVGRLHRPDRLVAGQDVQVVAGVALGDGEGVIALRDEQQIAVVDDVGLVDPAVGGVEPLQAEAVGRIDPVVVDLFEIGLARHVADVVLVRRIGRPVAARGEDLDDQQAVGGKLGLDDVVDLARGVAGAADLDLDVSGRIKTGS